MQLTLGISLVIRGQPWLNPWLFTGEPLLTLISDKGAQIPFKHIKNEDKTCRAEFTVIVSGTLTASVFFSGKPVPKSPFKVGVVLFEMFL